MKNKMFDETNISEMTLPEEYSRRALYSFPFDTVMSVQEFWMDGDDYENPEFWRKFLPVSQSFISATIIYDHLMKKGELP